MTIYTYELIFVIFFWFYLVTRMELTFGAIFYSAVVMMNSIKNLPRNCQGLGDKENRNDVLHFLRQNNFSIFFLQDTFYR